MPKTRPSVPLDPIEKDFMDALDRMKTKQPTDPHLAARAKLGTLKINFSTVAREAGRSRTLIALEHCRYPRVRTAVMSEMAPIVEPRTAEDVIRGLRQENAELRYKLRQADTVNAELVLRMRDIERSAKRDVRMAKQSTSRKQHPNRVVGVKKSSEQGQVIQFPRDDDKD